MTSTPAPLFRLMTDTPRPYLTVVTPAQVEDWGLVLIPRHNGDDFHGRIDRGPVCEQGGVYSDTGVCPRHPLASTIPDPAPTRVQHGESLRERVADGAAADAWAKGGA